MIIIIIIMLNDKIRASDEESVADPVSLRMDLADLSIRLAFLFVNERRDKAFWRSGIWLENCEPKKSVDANCTIGAHCSLLP